MSLSPRIRIFLRATGVVAGLWIGTATAQNWQRVQGIDSTRTILSHIRHNGIHFAAGDSLVYRSTDGVAWQAVATQPVSGEWIYGTLQAHVTGLYLGTSAHGVFHSTNEGVAWTQAGNGLPAEDVIALAALGDSLFAGVGFSGVYVLNLKNPTTWVPYNTGLTQFGSNSLSVVGNRLYAGLGLGFFARARGAAQWTEINLGAQRQVYEVMAAGSARYAATSSGVYRAASDTSTWRAIDIAPMPGKYIHALGAQGSRVFAGLNYLAQYWIWSTDDSGATWDVRAHEFSEIWDMLIVENRVWAARNDGIWYYDLGPVSIRKPARAFENRTLSESLKGRAVDGRRTRLRALSR
jgi:hypothetical protein